MYNRIRYQWLSDQVFVLYLPTKPCLELPEENQYTNISIEKAITGERDKNKYKRLCHITSYIVATEIFIRQLKHTTDTSLEHGY